LALEDPPNLIILDLMLPKLSGIEVLKELRASGSTTPILILTAKGNEVDKVLGLRLGADDYVTKPFGLMELMARVEALLRRTQALTDKPAASYTFGDVDINAVSQEVLRDGHVVELTPKEYGLLLALAQRGGAVASRIELMGEVWGHSSAVVSRTVDTHIAELRRKLEHDPARPRHITTVRKSGYRLDL
jgi:DNA-binding response OmpR family regulator